jgi:hypothetical protein
MLLPSLLLILSAARLIGLLLRASTSTAQSVTISFSRCGRWASTGDQRANLLFPEHRTDLDWRVRRAQDLTCPNYFQARSFACPGMARIRSPLRPYMVLPSLLLILSATRLIGLLLRASTSTAQSVTISFTTRARRASTRRPTAFVFPLPACAPGARERCSVSFRSYSGVRVQ